MYDISLSNSRNLRINLFFLTSGKGVKRFNKRKKFSLYNKPLPYSFTLFQAVSSFLLLLIVHCGFLSYLPLSRKTVPFVICFFVYLYISRFFFSLFFSLYSKCPFLKIINEYRFIPLLKPLYLWSYFLCLVYCAVGCFASKLYMSIIYYVYLAVIILLLTN